MADHDKPKPKRRSARTTALGGLLAVVALVAIWLSDCIPGFGIGDGSKDGEGEQADQVDPATPAAEPKTEPVEPAEPTIPTKSELAVMKLTVDARGCAIDDGNPIDCATLCDDPKLFRGVDSVLIDAKNGPHGVVMEVLDCIKTHGVPVAIASK